MLKHVTDEQRRQPGCSGGELGVPQDCGSRRARHRCIMTE